MVFDHRLMMLAQSVKKSMSPPRRCLDGSNCVNPMHCKFALRIKIRYERVGTHRSIETRDYKKIDSDKFLNDLVQQPWDLISLEPNPTAMWDAWKTLFMEIVDKHAPLKTKRISKKRPPSIT